MRLYTCHTHIPYTHTIHYNVPHPHPPPPSTHTEAVLEVWEQPLPMGARALHFNLIQGDFKTYQGCWVVEPDPSVRQGTHATLLHFEATLQPKQNLPSTIVSHVLVAGLPANILAVARRAEELSQRTLQVGDVVFWGGGGGVVFGRGCLG